MSLKDFRRGGGLVLAGPKDPSGVLVSIWWHLCVWLNIASGYNHTQSQEVAGKAGLICNCQQSRLFQ